MAGHAAFEPMLARAVEELPIGPAGSFQYEAKYDGYRIMATIGPGGRVRLVTRRGSVLSLQFPEITAVLAVGFPAGTVLDGELVRWSGEQRLDFAVVQRRAAAAQRRAHEWAGREPCQLIVFDLLRLARRDLTRSPLRERRELLEAIFEETAAGSLSLSLKTEDVGEARLWMDALARHGVEGVVAKPTEGVYSPGARGWMKVKRRTTHEGVVGAVTGNIAEPVRLVIGRRDAEGKLRIAAVTTVLSRVERGALSGLLLESVEEHPWPSEITVAWGHRPVAVTLVRPELVVEFSADNAVDRDGRWRHQVRYVRARLDR